MEKGISYSPDMVAAKKARRKTETRRLLPDSLLINQEPGRYKCHGIDTSDQGSVEKPVVLFEDLRPEITPWIAPIPVPYAAGDWLYTKEVWRTLGIYNDCKPVDVPADAPIWYDADGPAPAEYGKYRYARFMPKKFARFWDEVTAVRCEQVQHITETGAQAEGAYQGILLPYGMGDWQLQHNCHASYKEGFQYIWYKVYSPYSWDLNPWIFAVTSKELSRTGYPRPEPTPYNKVDTEAVAEVVAESAAAAGGIALTDELRDALQQHPGQEPAVLAGYELGLGDLREVLRTLDTPRRLGLPDGQVKARCINELPGPLVRILNVAVAAQHLKHWLPFGVQSEYFSKDELRGLRFLESHLDTFSRNLTSALVARKVFAGDQDRTGAQGLLSYTEGLADLLATILGDLNGLPDPREGQAALRMYTELNMLQAQPTEAWDEAFGSEAASEAVEELVHG